VLWRYGRDRSRPIIRQPAIGFKLETYDVVKG
jgi:hypothetical protein